MSWTNKRRNWKVNNSGPDGTDKQGKWKELGNMNWEKRTSNWEMGGGRGKKGAGQIWKRGEGTV